MIALVGDAELDEGNVYECLLEGWKHDVRNLWWIVDYNRQSLDGVVREGLFDRIEAIFRAFGWGVVTLKYGKLQQAAFAEPGGESSEDWIDACPNAALLGADLPGRRGLARAAAATRSATRAEVTRAARAPLTTTSSPTLMTNLGGHCIETLLEAVRRRADDDRPTLFIAYTVKGFGLPLAGPQGQPRRPDDPGADRRAARRRWASAPGQEWEPLRRPRRADARAATPSSPPCRSRRRPPPAHRAAPSPTLGPQFAGPGGRAVDPGGVRPDPRRDRQDRQRRWPTASSPPRPTSPSRPTSAPGSTGAACSAARARRRLPDASASPSAQKWAYAPTGQHIELGIAENNLFLLLGARWACRTAVRRAAAAGRHGLRPVHRPRPRCAELRLLPGRALPAGRDALGRHAGAGGRRAPVDRHAADRHGQDGLAAFEPAFADELAMIMDWAFDHMQRDGEDGAGRADLAARRNPAARSICGSRPGRSSSRRARSTPTLARRHHRRRLLAARRPARTARWSIAYQGVLAPRGHRGGRPDRRTTGATSAVLAVTSADRLNAGWHAAQHAREARRPRATRHIERLLADVPRALRHRHRHRRPSGDARLARQRAAATARSRWASSISARPARSPTSTATSASTPESIAAAAQSFTAAARSL